MFGVVWCLWCCLVFVVLFSVCRVCVEVALMAVTGGSCLGGSCLGGSCLGDSCLLCNGGSLMLFLFFLFFLFQG